MRWRDWQKQIDRCEVVIYYNDSKLYPISEWLHPGTLPIGTGLKDDIRQDLPNLDWIIRHVAWLGFRNITVVSHENFRGLDRFYINFSPKLTLNFTNIHFSEVVKDKITKKIGHVILISGLVPTNSDLRHAFMLHRQRSNVVSLLSIRGLQFRVGLADIKENHQIRQFREKPVDRSMLINSNILIIDTSRIFEDLTLMEKYFRIITEPNFSIEEIIKLSIKYFLQNMQLRSVELTGVSGDPWFIDLSLLEKWVKLDHDEFIDQFSHLITES